MIVIIKECFSISLKRILKVNEKISFSEETEQAIIDSGFALHIKETKEKKITIKKK